MTTIPEQSSISIVLRIDPGIVVKRLREVSKEVPHYERLSSQIRAAFEVEHGIFQLLGNHPRIVQYMGLESLHGILLAEASHGSLQSVLNSNKTLSQTVRHKWCVQVAESIVYVHSKGVSHSDLRPDNFLVHATTDISLDILLCDFGGSHCAELGLYGGNLPDFGFFDPRAPQEPTEATDIFSLGSVMYVILTRCWHHRTSGLPEDYEEDERYSQEVEALFGRDIFPAINDPLGDLITGCWSNDFDSAQRVLKALSRKVENIT